MATISIDGNTMTVAVQGLDRLWALKSHLTIPPRPRPRRHRGPEHRRRLQGLARSRRPHPRCHRCRDLHQDGKLIFWDVHDTSKAVVIELEDDTCQSLVIGVSDPRATVELIEHAVASG